MPLHFGLSIRFLDLAFHGRRDGALPEWPPSPLRVFQSLVAAAAARGRGKEFAPRARSALRWLEEQTERQRPTLVTPASITASGYRLSVPNNAMDIVARAWCRGDDSSSGDANPATHRTMKTVRPTLLLNDDAIHYLWPLSEPVTNDVHGHVETLGDIARSLVALGWGVDMVVGHGAIVTDEQASALSGQRWLPSTRATGDGLRVPLPGTLDALIERHKRFLARLSPDGSAFTAPPPLSTYKTVEYRMGTHRSRSSVAAFSLLKLDASGFRAFDPARRALTVAGMVRYAAKVAAEHAGWPESKINAFILGHGESKATAGHVAPGPNRFAYLPLPSIEARGNGKARVAGSVRRVALICFAEDCDAELTWAQRALSGQELIDEDTKQPVALLSLLSANEKLVRHYTQPAASWATVTPVVLPGYDDPSHYRRRLKQGTSAAEQKRLLNRLDDRVDGLLRKSITQAGFSQVLADHVELDWRRASFWPGADRADHYGVPDHLKRFPRYHVRLDWRDAHQNPVQIPGPVCLGSGRFFGLGLFAAL